MQQNSVKKICFLVDCLSKGGAERAAAKLSKELSKAHAVTIISLLDDVTYEYSGTLFNLGIDEPSFKIKKQLQKTIRLRKIVMNLEPDVIVDFRMRNRWFMEFVIYQFVLKSFKVVYRINSFKIDWHIPKGAFFKRVYKKSQLVAVAKDIQNELLKKGYKNVNYIPNYVAKPTLEATATFVFPEKGFIVAVGSLRNDIKQFDKLVIAYANSVLPSKGIKLFVIGEGPDKERIHDVILKQGVSDKVELLGYKSNVYEYMKHAKFLVLCSVLEGFPNVLVESLAVNTPVISFDCKSGPYEIIIHKENGLLVPDQDFELLTSAINTLAVDEQLYQHCKNNTEITLQNFTKETVLDKWLKILN